ncbi:GlxA family transcriptional regulator [Phytohalomonas tamaricis]|uniref:GlxA family transcriptional regulator n=1 Tax=Phytohalomonas tamaricis TaxID=2081032 RepID=UPI000D0BDACB|nr:helix-turn-helix domain-containing protein [Phytohalomonas tamaricis]
MPSEIDVFIYPNCQLLDASGPWQVFASANELAGEMLYRLRLLAIAPGPVRTNGGMTLLASHALETTSPGDTLLIAGGSGVDAQRRDSTLLERLRQRAPLTRRVGAVCTGAFLLAAAGLLDGRSATTHWRHCQRLVREFPAVDVAPDALYVESNGLYTSAGVTAGIDLALSLLAADHGSRLAGEVARELVVFLHRPGGQAQFSETLRAQLSGHGRLRTLIDELSADPSVDVDLDTLAARLAVTPRHLHRLFQRELGLPPGAFLTRLRLEAARRRLLESSDSVTQIAERCRIGGAEQLRRLFQRHYGLPPRVYRARFGAHRQEGTP